jgi:small subunit ribosomal protein S15
MENKNKKSENLNIQIDFSNSGSTVSQMYFLTQRINMINGHLGINPKDHSGRRGLMIMVGKRNRLSKYLHRKDLELHKKLISYLGLRK